MKNKQDYILDPLSVLVLHYSGSISYGTNTPKSDTDFRGVFLAEDKYRTPFFSINEHEIKEEEDTKLYELERFVTLCSECNPTYLETLFIDEQFITKRTPAYDYLRSQRDAFISKGVGSAYLHYADGQYRRILGHDKWHNNPQPKERPEMKDYVKLINNFTSQKIFNRDFNFPDYKGKAKISHYGNNIFAMFEDEGKNPFRPDGSLNPIKIEGDDKKITPDFLIKFNEKEYTKAVANWKNYWKWMEERNEDRAALEKEHGYDTKHGLHIVRLLRMAREASENGSINVLRDDAEELKAIRFEGTWSLDDIGRYIEQTRGYIHDKLKESSLPENCDHEEIAKILVNARKIHQNYVNELSLESEDGYSM